MNVEFGVSDWRDEVKVSEELIDWDCPVRIAVDEP